MYWRIVEINRIKSIKIIRKLINSGNNFSRKLKTKANHRKKLRIDLKIINQLRVK